MFRSFVRSLFRTRKPRPIPCSSRQGRRLGFEQLEDRLTPASMTFYWKGVNSTFALATNWFSAVGDHTIPTAGDTIVYGVGEPIPGPVLPGEPPPAAAPSVFDCTIDDGYAFLGVYLNAPYSGTVTVQDNTSTGVLEIRNGAIAQTAATDGLNNFSVTSYLYFVRGSFNDTANPGILQLSTPALTPNSSTIGDTASTPAYTVTMGSILQVNGNVTLFYTNGTIAFARGSYFDSEGGSTITPSSLTGDSVFTHISGTKNPHLVQGNFMLKSNSHQAFWVKTGGHLQVVKSLEIAGHTTPTDTTTGSLTMTGGLITATHSIQLKVNNGFAMSGGVFTTTHDGVTNGEYTLHLTGDMKMTGGMVDLYKDANGLHLAALSVYGNVTFTGGTYFARYVGTATSDECHRWISSGTFTTTAAATITTMLSSGTLPAKANPAREWEIITSTVGIPMTVVAPTVAPDVVGITGDFSNDRKKFNLNW